MTDASADPGQYAMKSSRDPEDVRRRLEGWLSGRLGPTAAPRVSGVTGTSANGQSSDTVLFDASWSVDGRPVSEQLVARVAPAAGDVPVFPRYDLTAQYDTIRLAGELAGIPVPPVRWNESDPAVLGAPFFVMSRVEGVVPPDIMPYTFGDNWLHDAATEDQQRLVRSTLDVIARLHAIEEPERRFPFLATDAPGAGGFERRLAWTEAWYRFAVEHSSMRSPLVERGFAWLREHLPPERASVVVWGDSRIGNVLYRDFEPVAVLDWEMACLGPRELDLAWIIYAHHVFDQIAAGFGLAGMPHFLRPADTATVYEQLSGHTPGDLDPYFTLAALQWGVVFLRTGARQVHFGDIDPPEDPESLMHHREGLERMLAAGTWGLW